jgi:hypothetical protein
MREARKKAKLLLESSWRAVTLKMKMGDDMKMYSKQLDCDYMN